MANKHILSLDIPDTLNTKIMRIVDTSVYSEELNTACGRLQILVPGYTEAVTLELTPGYDLIVSACMLGIQSSNCNTAQVDLPDGMYTIRYSVAPNDKVFVEYNYLRVAKAMTTYYQLLCNLDLSGCEPLAPQKEKLNKLRLLRTMLDGAKAKIEYCHNTDQGMAIYNYVVTQFDKLACKYCN